MSESYSYEKVEGASGWLCEKWGMTLYSFGQTPQTEQCIEADGNRTLVQKVSAGDNYVTVPPSPEISKLGFAFETAAAVATGILGCGPSENDEQGDAGQRDAGQTCPITIGGETLACDGDIDQDGVLNQEDHCPLVRGGRTIGGLTTGCPDTPVPPVNHSPLITVPSEKQANEGEEIVFTAQGRDPDGTPVSLSATPLPEGATFDSASGLFRWTPTFEQAGTYTVNFTVSSAGLSSTSETRIVVHNVNRPLVLVSPGNKTINEGETLEFSVTATDPDGDPLVFSGTSLPNGATLDPTTGAFNWTPDFDQAGNYSVEFQVSDGDSSVSQTVAIAVGNVNHWSPQLDPIGNKAVNEGQSLHFFVRAADPEGDPITYSAVRLPPGATLDTASGLFQWTPGYHQEGSYPVTFVASDGILQDSEESVITVSNVPVVQVDAGGHYACAVMQGGSVLCWGNNDFGQSTPPSGTFTQVSAGYSHTCGVLTTGAVECWGDNSNGQSTPPTGTFTQVSVGNYYTCGVLTTGAVKCWGYNFSGQATPPSGTFTQVSADYDHTCGVLTTGAVECWGNHYSDQSTPPAGTFTQVSAGYDHTCGVLTTGAVKCWGYNSYGQSTSPSGTFTQVSSGYDYTCGDLTGGAVECWGDNNNGQSTPPAGTFTQVSAGYNHTCGVLTGGTVECWGGNSYGESQPPF